MGTHNREWMYNNRTRVAPEFVSGVQEFARVALSKPDVVTIDAKGRKCIPCPCQKCANLYRQDVETVKIHLYKHGFCALYGVWHKHGESVPEEAINPPSPPPTDPMEEMLRAAAGPHFDWDDDQPTGIAKKFFDMLAASETPLWEENSTGPFKCENHTILSAVTQALALKSEHQLSQKCYDGMMSLIKSVLPPSSKMPDSFYQSKRLIDGMGMEQKKIDVCPNFCMLYYKRNEDKTCCHVCQEPRYKPPGPNKDAKPIPQKTLRYLPITPRFQRMYMTESSAKNMRWHKEGKRDKPGIMVHPADGEAWKHFMEKYPEFAKEVRNVVFGITTDGFMPFNSSAAPYSCWPVFIFPYNLPPGMIMKQDTMFLALVIPGPKHPGRDIDILLEPLIDELNTLWLGEMTWDAYRKENFNMRASLIWTVSDYPAYEMLCGWGTHGRLACYYCQEKTKAFRLVHGGKPVWFDCHRCMLPPDHPFRRDKKNFIKGRAEYDGPPHIKTGEEILEEVSQLDEIVWGKTKTLDQIEGYKDTHHWQKKSIFWSLPYWKDNLLPHNIDIMHLEKNFADNLIYTLLSIGGKTKDNEKSRKDLALICDRPSQHLTPHPRISGKMIKNKAPYALTLVQKRKVLTWLKDLVKFPDGYASNWSRCVNLTTCTLIGLKSHDMHVFMERLLPVAFRDFVPDEVWDVLCEISSFFREICAKELLPSRIDQLENDIIVTICKMEKNFPPSFFDSMEHLVVHVAHEARMGGPVGSRWMFPCERRNKEQRMRVTNKARVEGSIVEATIVKEISTFCSKYFEGKSRDGQLHVTKSTPSHGGLSIFYNLGRHVGKENRVVLNDKDYKAAHYYVLQNCPEIRDKYEREFDTCMLNGGTRPQDLDKVRQESYGDWLREKVLSIDDCDNYIRKAGLKPSKVANCYEVYDINGYRFHTENYGKNKATKSSGVCIKGEWDENGEQHDYYGILQDIVELNYDGANKVALFKCIWFDITNGVKRDKKHGIVEVKHASRLKGFEPYVLACQAIQVVYIPYASDTPLRRQWWVAMKTSPKGKFRVEEVVDENIEFYQEEMTDNPVLEPNEEGFNWDNEVIIENEFELVDDTMEISPIVADNENPIEEGDEGYDTEQEYDMQEIEEGLGYGLNLGDQSDEDGY